MAAYDVCIVGAGLWGSAAARHASKPGCKARKVCLVGPSEPSDEERPCREIFSSYYDAGRSVRKYQGMKNFRTLISMRTFKSIKELEKTTGVQLFKEVGHLMYGEKLEAQLSSDAQEAGVFLSSAQVANRYPFLDISHYGDNGFLFPHDAGYVNPRLLVGTQQRVARQQGCDIIDDVVESVMETEIDGEPMMQATTKSGTILKAKKVLLCTGVFTNFKELLPPHLKLDLIIRGTFLLKMEVNEADVERFNRMPTMSSYTDPSRSSYSLPPLFYPDGKFYLKVGPLNSATDGHLKTLEEVKLWYLVNKPSEAQVKNVRDLLLGVVKDFHPLSVQEETCATLKTPTKLPYCDMVSPRLGVAIGGNGVGAMMSDEMGRMAAEMIAGIEDWNLDIPKEKLKARFFPRQASL